MNARLVEALRALLTTLPEGWAGAEEARAALAEAEAPTDAQSASKSVQKRLSVQTGGEAPTVAQPVAALMRSRSVTTWPHLSVDGKTHYSEWGDWLPTTYKHAKAVTDPSRNADPVCYEMQPLYAEAPTVAQPAQEPVRVEAVATVQAGEDGLYLDWLIEGGICALEEGCALVVPSRPITDDLGSGEVYTAPPQPVALTDEQIDAIALAPGDYRTFARAIERATIQPASCGQLREKCV